MSAVSILHHTKLYREKAGRYDGIDVQQERTPDTDMQYILNHTKYAFADVQDTASPLERSVMAMQRRKKKWSRAHIIPNVLLILGILAIVVLAMMDKASPYLPLMQKVGSVGIVLAVTFPFQHIIVAFLTNKPTVDYAHYLTAARARMYLLTDGTLAVLNDNYDDYAGEKREARGTLKPAGGGTILDLKEKRVFPFCNCVYIQSVSKIEEADTKDMLMVVCSGVMYVLHRPLMYQTHSRDNRRDPFYHYTKVQFQEEMIYLPKRYVDGDYFEQALNALR